VASDTGSPLAHAITPIGGRHGGTGCPILLVIRDHRKALAVFGTRSGAAGPAGTPRRAPPVPHGRPKRNPAYGFEGAVAGLVGPQKGAEGTDQSTKHEYGEFPYRHTKRRNDAATFFAAVRTT
jgi:hypothetical protein